MFFIYKITNVLNNMIYIGQTIRTISVRVTEHKSKDTHLGRSIQKYGIDNFIIECLHEVDTIDELNKLEAQYVTDEFVADPNTYNYRLGGGNNGKHSLASKLKISIARTGTNHTDETKQKITVFHKNNPPSETMRNKMSHSGELNGCYGRTGQQHPLFQTTRPEHSEFMKQHHRNNPRQLNDSTRAKLRTAQTGKRIVRNADGTRNFIPGEQFHYLLELGIITKIDGHYHRGDDLS